MAAMLGSWDFDDTTQWLRPVDLYIAARMLALADNSQGQRSILEIGVWKGAWLLQLTATQPDVLGLGVDPYPGSPTLRQQVLDLAAAKRVADRTLLVPTTSDVCAAVCEGDSHRSVTLAHIDGLHAEHQVEADISYAARHCADDGVIIVDDHLHPAYPGIASAMYRFLADRQFAMFLTTGNKAYICRAVAHPEWYSATEQMLAESGLVWTRHRGDRYLQPPDVMDFGVLLCIDAKNDETVLAGLHPPARYTVRRIADRWIPTGFRDRVRPIKHGAQRLLGSAGDPHRRRAVRERTVGETAPAQMGEHDLPDRR